MQPIPATRHALIARRGPSNSVFADTFCYFGSLSEPLSGAEHALRSGGLLAFTVERAADGEHGYRLNSSGRFSHAEAYVHAAVLEAGLHLVDVEVVELRQEGGQAVSGLLVSAGRPEAIDPFLSDGREAVGGDSG